MTSDFAPEVAKYPKPPKTPHSPKWGSRLLSKIGAKFCYPNRKSGSPSKNPSSYFALKVAKYLQPPYPSPQKKQIAQNGELDN